MNLATLDWDDAILADFGIPKVMLPKVCSSAEVYGEAVLDAVKGVPVAGILVACPSSRVAHRLPLVACRSSRAPRHAAYDARSSALAACPVSLRLRHSTLVARCSLRAPCRVSRVAAPPSLGARHTSPGACPVSRVACRLVLGACRSALVAWCLSNGMILVALLISKTLPGAWL